MIVHKFGGTSVGNAERFARVADIIQAQATVGEPVGDGGHIVVVSAMSGVTSQLITGARAAADGRDRVFRQVKADLSKRHLDVVDTLLGKSAKRLDVSGYIEDRLHDLERLYRSLAVLGELTLRGADTVSSFGEQLSVTILAAVLRERGLRSQAIIASDLIVTDDQFGNAAPLEAPTRERLVQIVQPLVKQGVIPVITGYIGATESGIPTTLGRGGSDYSAAIIGANLNADEVWIWSDVDGILTADPNLVPKARALSELSYSEAANLAYYGADVLHPKTIRPVIRNRIPLRILNSYNPGHPGTLIVDSPSSEREVLPAILSSTGLTLIAIGSVDDSWTTKHAAQALQQVADAGLEIPMFSQSFSEHSLNLIVRQQDQEHCLQVLGRHLPLHCKLGTTEQVATVSVVGVPGWNQNGIVSHAFAALGRCGTRVIAVAQAATENSVSFCIPQDQVEETVRYLHRDLGLESDD